MDVEQEFGKWWIEFWGADVPLPPSSFFERRLAKVAFMAGVSVMAKDVADRCKELEGAK